jgi:hypothetical protein
LILVDLFFEVFFSDQRPLVLAGHRAIDNDAFDKTVHVLGFFRVGLLDILTPRLEPHESFESHHLVLDAHLQHKALDWQALNLRDGHVTKTNEMKIKLTIFEGGKSQEFTRHCDTACIAY